MPGWLHRLDTVRELLTVGGRTLVQGALGYLLALDPSIIPLPGIRTEQQARENTSVLVVGPLPQAETAEITALLADSRSVAEKRSWLGWWVVCVGRHSRHDATPNRSSKETVEAADPLQQTDELSERRSYS